MNWGFRSVLVSNKPLIDDGSEIQPASIGVPVEPPYANRLDAHYGGKHFHANRPPSDYAGFDPRVSGRQDWYPHDTMSFGGYHGGNFLERDAKNSTWKHQ